ncbi:retrotransposon protein, putative, ty1-copia subclass [Tanacetum coccineum]
MTTSVGNNSVFRSFFEKQKLTGPNFIDWYRQLRLVLSTEDKENYLEHPIPVALVAQPGQLLPHWRTLQASCCLGLKCYFSKQAELGTSENVREFHICKRRKVNRLAPSKKRIEKLQHDGLLNSIDIESLGKCVSCLSGKMARKPYSHQVERAKDLLGLIHTDVFQKEVENQLGKTIKSLRSDRGGEYMSQEFLDHLKEHGIIAHRTPPYTPQNNGVSERRNRTLLDMVRSMMSQTTLPKSFWDYALETAARILNMVPSKKVDKTPYEIWHGQAPKLSYLRVWGCEAFVKHDTLTKPDKLDPRSFKSIFVGYPKETMGYSFYSPSENKVFVARNAEFFESKLLDLKASGSVEDLEEIQEEDTNPSVDTSLNHEEDDQEIDEPQSDINPIRRSTRTRRPTDRLCLYIDTKEHELGDLGEPANYKATLLDLESKKWLDVMNVEMQSMKDNDVWVLVELPPNARTVGSKWLFKKKTDMDDIRAIKILIAIATYYDYEIWQMDVKTAFLNGHLSIIQPEIVR